MALVESIITEKGIVERDKVKVSIDRLKAFEPPEGYYLAFSGGKDSQVVYQLAKEAEVKFDAHYNITGIDPPELVYFIRENYPDVQMHMYEESMFRLIENRGLPSRKSRFCCDVLKEHGGEGRIVLTGVRWAESVPRQSRKPFEIVTTKKEDKKLFNDNSEERKLFENCMQKGKRVINPIIDWEDSDVWDYIHLRELIYCILYDMGFDRIGCIGCPNAGEKGMEFEFSIYPKFKENYIRAIKRFVPKYLERCKNKNRKPLFTTAEGWFDWWVHGKHEEICMEGQENIFDEVG